MNSKTVLIIALVLITIVLGGAAIFLGGQLTEPPDTTPGTDTPVYDTPSITVTVTTTTTVVPTTTVPPTTVVTSTLPPETTAPPETTIPPTVSPTLQETAIVSDEADRIILAVIIILAGIIVVRLNLVMKSYERLVSLKGSFQKTLTYDRKKDSFEKTITREDT